MQTDQHRDFERHRRLAPLLFALLAVSAPQLAEAQGRQQGRSSHYREPAGKSRRPGDHRHREALRNRRPLIKSRWRTERLLKYAAGTSKLFRSKADPSVRLRYKFTGDGPKTIVLLNGSLVNRHQWSDLLPILRERLGSSSLRKGYRSEFRFLQIDYPGFGGSEGGLRGAKELGDLVAELMEHTGVEKAHFIAFSLGGLVAQSLAAHHPERVHTLASVGTPDVSSDANRRHLQRQFKRKLEPLKRRLSGERGRSVTPENQKKVASALAESGGTGVAGFFADLTVSNWVRGNSVDAMVETVQRFSDDAHYPSTSEQQRTLSLAAAAKIPTVLYIGTSDQTTPPTMTEALQRKLPHATSATLDNARHSSLLLNDRVGSQFADHYARWLSNHESGVPES